ncbi:MAG: chemotaxis protein CheB, partial [Synergistetes bacterium]|nr:chemotaxis protein CheB [Synergistota bacterium]
INLSMMKFKEVSPIKKKKEVKGVPYLKTAEKILVIGTSTGGPRALQEVVPKIPANIESGILIVQHMPPKFTRSLAERLDSLSELVVKEAEDGDKVLPGVALVAPGDYHMVIERDGKEFRVRNVKTPPIGKLRPAVDVTMLSVAEVWNGFIVGVIMTGMGKDGAKGMLMIKKRGGRTIVEDKSTCVVYGMPRAVVEIGAADIIVPLYEIPKKIVEVIRS